MGRILVIAEKPSVGRDIARTLGCNQKAEGLLYSQQYIVSWAVGHLVTLCEPEDYDERWKRWTMSTLPVIPGQIKLKPIAKTRSQLVILRKLMKSKDVDSVICATDSGREGELIFRYIYDLCGCTKPVQRLWISSMTDVAIKEGFDNLRSGADYDNLYQSAKCRSEADWLVGINATRAYTVRYNVLLSVGRVQTPTLAIIVNRHKEISDFKPKDYWEIMAQFCPDASSDNAVASYRGKWLDRKSKESRLDTLEEAEAIVAKVRGQEGVVTGIKEEEKRQPPPLLYDLTELQRDCNKKFGFSAQHTLDIAQELYEKRKMITYPRTDSRYLSADIVPKLPNAVKKLQTSETYRPYADYLLGLDKLPTNKRIVDDSKVSDHHAIIPTLEGKLTELMGDAAKVFDLVARRFLAVFYPYYTYYITTITTEVAGERFTTKGKTIKALGWMELYQNDKHEAKEDEDEEAVLPEVTKGQTVKTESAEAIKKQTKPPKPYTEASLLSAMENAGRFIEDDALKEQLKDSGLGTPATRAATIERLLQVGYIERKKKTLMPTEKGIKLIEVVPAELRSPETTGKWEKGLTSIAKGKMQPERFMGSITRYVEFIVEQAQHADMSVAFPEESRRKYKKPASKRTTKKK